MGSTQPPVVPPAAPGNAQAPGPTAPPTPSGTAAAAGAASGSPEPPTIPLPGFGSALSTVVAIVAPLYALGLLVVRRKLHLGEGLDDATAWHAATLVDRPTVALQAIEALLSWPALLVAALSFAYVGAVEWQTLAASFVPVRSRLASRVIAIVPLVALSVALTEFVNRYGISSDTYLATLSILLFSNLLLNLPKSLQRAFKLENRKRWWLLGTYLASLNFAYYAIDVHASFLPTVSIPQAKGPAPTGVLVAHDNGYWYVIQATKGGVRLQMVKDDAATHLVAPPGTPIP